MLPAQDTAHVAEGLDLVISQYRGKPNLAALLTALLAQVQKLEDATWAVIHAPMLSRNPTGQALRQVADLVGCPVGLLTDAQLLFLVRIWILARKSKGRAVDLLALLAAAFANAFAYEEYAPAAFEVWVPAVPDAALVAPLAEALRIARDPGVHAVLAWGAWPTAMFFFADPYGGGAGSGLKDPYSATNAEGLLAGIEV